MSQRINYPRLASFSPINNLLSSHEDDPPYSAEDDRISMLHCEQCGFQGPTDQNIDRDPEDGTYIDSPPLCPKCTSGAIEVWKTKK